jgi:hypothetical protein
MKLEPEGEEKKSLLGSPVILAVLIGILGGVVIERVVLRPKQPAPTTLSAPTTPTPDAADSGVMPVPTPDDPRALLPLANPDIDARERTVLDFVRRKDKRIVSPLVLLQWAGSVEMVPPLNDAEFAGLRELTGQSFTNAWEPWAEWWWAQPDTEMHPGFPHLQAHLFSQIHPGFAELLRPDLKPRIRKDEIVWGGVPVDGIPALTAPAMLRASAPEAAKVADDEPVFGIAVGGVARAYPQRLLDWHELVNDTLGDQPVCLAYCTLCGAAVAYDPYVTGLGRLIFATSGLLRRSNKLMFDHQTRTLWQALTGQPVVGPLAVARPEAALKTLPVVRTTWARWKSLHPETTVLSHETGYQRDYTLGAPYGDYFKSPDTMFPVAPRSPLLNTKAWVFGLSLNAKPKAYPVDIFKTNRVVLDTLDGQRLALIGDADWLEVRAYELDNTALTWDSERRQVVDSQTRQAWTVAEDALRSPEGKRFPRIPGHLAYWFAWYATHEGTALFRTEPSKPTSPPAP